jgi:O-antigen/teichoic acid export membrane protein
VRNSFWGLAANVSQSLLMSLFYVILARKYATADFSSFLIANSLYQFLVAISNLGLGQWFTREIVGAANSAGAANTVGAANSVGAANGEGIVGKFLQLQLYSGVGFYLANCLLALLLYDNHEIRVLTVLMGINIVFDNLIYVVKCLNIARSAQNITFKIIIVDSGLKFLGILLLLFFPFSIVVLSAGLIGIRFLTLNLFLRYGSKGTLDWRVLVNYRISLNEVTRIVRTNWPFLVIGSVSIVYWRIGNIIISKMLSLFDVAVYEISFRVFSVFQILPVIVSASVFPHLVALYNSGDTIQFNAAYKRYFSLFLFYGLFVYTFMFSFSGGIIPFLFGPSYATAAVYTREMFLTMLLFPTGVLQATVLISMKLERVDMAINIISLIASVALICTGLSFIRSLTVVNYSIFISFLLFHICQDYILVKRKILAMRNVINFYFFTTALVVGYVLLAPRFRPISFFAGAWGLAAIVLGVTQRVKTARTQSAIAETPTL